MPTETSQGYFPDTIGVDWDYTVRRKRRVRIKESKTGLEQRKNFFPLRFTDGTGHKGGYLYLEGSTQFLSVDNRFIISDFIDQMEGNLKAFWIFRKDLDYFSNYDIGDVAGASTYLIPGKETIITVVTVNDVGKTFTITPNIGTGGEDRINFSAGAQTGRVRISGKLRERVLVRFDFGEDEIQTLIADTMHSNWRIPLAVKQLRSSS